MLNQEIKVLESDIWIWGKHNTGVGGQYGQITKCIWNNIVFYTRENVTAIDRFFISSAERQSEKKSLSEIRPERQSLELFAPEQYWDTIANIIKIQDPLKRPIIKCRNFNLKWIEENFNK